MKSNLAEQIEIPEILSVPYFAYEVLAWDSWRHRIPLDSSQNVGGLIERLESGENLFEVIPQFNRKELDKFRLKYATFETRDEVRIGDRTFLDEKGYQQVGRLFVPDYRIKDEEVDTKKTFVLKSAQL